MSYPSLVEIYLAASKLKKTTVQTISLLYCGISVARLVQMLSRLNSTIWRITINSCRLSDYLLCLIFFLLFEEVGEIDEFLHGLHLSAQVLQIHATGPAVRLQQQAKPLAHCLVVHL